MQATPPLLLQRVVPLEFVRKAVGSLDGFMLAYGETPLLCVDLSADPNGDLEVGLAAALEAGGHLHNIGFHTVVGGSKMVEPSRGPHGVSAPALAQRLLLNRHFVLPLAKHSSTAMSQERIGVGRARNQDVVLRHGSVSKYHAWFQVEVDGTVLVADAGSTNGTKVDGKALAPKQLTEVRPGTPITFGKVPVLLCEPVIMWKAFHL